MFSWPASCHCRAESLRQKRVPHPMLEGAARNLGWPLETLENVSIDGSL